MLVESKPWLLRNNTKLRPEGWIVVDVEDRLHATMLDDVRDTGDGDDLE